MMMMRRLEACAPAETPWAVAGVGATRGGGKGVVNDIMPVRAWKRSLTLPPRNANPMLSPPRRAKQFSIQILPAVIQTLQHYPLSTNTRARIGPSPQLPPEVFFARLLTMPTETLTFSPACPEPLIIGAEERIRELREMLLDKSLEFQHKNISFLIQLYETSQLPPAPGQSVWILDGKIVDGRPKKIPKGSVVWVEVCLTLFYLIALLT
jgi:hypothetical protein